MSIEELSNHVADVLEAQADSVVRIEARRRGGGASGIVYSSDGLIVAALHTFGRDENIHVGLASGERAKAEIVGADPGRDLVLLRVEGHELKPPTWRNLDGLRIGNFLLTIARPGRTPRASMGILGVLGEGWRSRSGGEISAFVQGDYKTQRGFSGGLVLDTEGQAIGMTTSGLFRRQHIVLPTATLVESVEALAAHGGIRRGFIGVVVQPVALPSAAGEASGQEHGLLLSGVEEGGPADQAGLMLGDVLLQVGDTALSHPVDLRAQLGTDTIHSEVLVTLWRAGELKTIEVTVGERG